MSGETKFSVMVSLFNWIQKSKSAQKKRSKFRKFLDSYCKPADYFDSIRLILPSLDRERGSYGLKEGVLATCLIDALGMSKESEDAQRLVNWRKGGAKAGVNAGNFALIASEVLQRRQGMISGGLTIKELNDYLDRLASSENRTEKTNVLSHLIKRTNAQEMKWIVMIILKDLKLGISEKSIFHEFHPDAEDLFNVTCDLKLVCEKLKDRNQRHKRQDIEVGKAVRPQLAMRVSNVAAAWKKLHGKEVVVECKFDGDRIQIHKNGNEIHFFSRNFLDHPEYSHGMSSIILSNILVDRCILDGEMLVWDASLNRFAEFGSNQEIAKAAKEGLDSDRQLCYVAFDILYDGDTSVIHQSLKERHELLRKVVKPIKGRFEILIPNGGLNAHRPPGELCWSFVARHTDDVEKFFKETIENRDEGIVLKDLGSKWEPSDRSGKWLKLKPEYIRAGSDLDVLIIGGYYGSGRHGGEVAQFLVGLAKRSASATFPRRFISFCRVGTGLSDEELDTVVKKLKPYFRKYEYPKKASPSYYEVTNNSKERPDVWVESPEKSIIVSITSDIRTIKSEVFAAPYSLRFPRIHRVRYDKPWHECLDVESFVESVQSSNGTTQRGEDYGVQQDDSPKRSKSSRRGGKQGVSVVPSHFIQTDVSHIKGETLIFKNMMFYFANLPMTHSLDSLHKMVAENGGTFSMNLNSSVTRCVAAECRGIKFNAAKRHGDVIHVSWLLDCCSQKKLLPLQPKYFLVLSDSSKNKLQEEIDEYSDSYFWDVDIDDIRQLLSNINRSEDSKRVDYYKKKFCPKDKWSRFHGCCMYFHLPTNLLNMDWKAVMELAQRRMKLEVSFGGGNVSENLFHATHLVVMSLPGVAFDFDSLLSSFEAPVKRLLYKKQLHVVESRWLEDCFERDQRLQEEEYSLKPSGLDELTIEECKHSFDQKDESSLENVENSNLASSSDKDTKQRWRKTAFANQRITTSPMNVKRKRGRPASSRTNKGKSGPTQTPRRTRTRIINKAPKICESESDINISSDEKIAEQEPEHGGSDHESLGEEVKQKSQLTNKGNTALKRPQRTKRRIASKPAKLHGNESDSNTSLGDNDCIKQEADLEGSHKEGKQNPVVGESEPSIRDRTLERDTEYGKLGGWLDKSKGMASGSSTQGTTENLEIRVDPIQAMLLDMIPSLGLLTHTVKSVNPILETKSTTRDRNYMVPRLGTEMSESADPLPKREMPTLDRTMIPNLGKMSESADPLPKREMSTQDVNPVPGKKKKVSYKDLAAELLRD